MASKLRWATSRLSEDLELAWRRVLNDTRDDLVPDPLSYRDFITTKADFLRHVHTLLQDGYTPSSLLHMEVPKDHLSVRLGAVPLLEDRLAYTAVVGSFAERADAALEDETVVPSYRVKAGNTKAFFKFGINQWFKFQNLMRQAYSDGYTYVLLTDLAAYFDHIDHDLLLGQLRGLKVPEKTLTFLEGLLGSWSHNSPIGIPQGLDPSSLLGNIYLDPLDKHMIREKYYYFRYVDDIRVFANSESELRRAMLAIIRQTRELGLHVQTAKTRIFQGDEILELINERREELAAIDYHIGLGYNSLAESEVMEILRDLTRQDSFNERHFRKCLNSLRKMKSAAGVKPTVQNLNDLQSAAQSVAEYLTPFARRHVSIKRSLIEFLMDEERNIFDWPEFWFARTLESAASLPREFLDWCRSRVQDPNCHWNCRGQYALLLGTHGDFADRQLLRRLVSSRDNDYERRAFVAGLRALPEPQKGNVMSQLQRDYPAVAPTLALVGRPPSIR